jgi:plasmid stabilization system protein ParE
MNYYFEEHAREELRDAVSYYEAIDPDLGSRFSAAVESAISLIRQFPNAWPPLSPTTRRCRTKRFPYGIIYRIKDEIQILAVAHFSRRPNYWVDRL